MEKQGNGWAIMPGDLRTQGTVLETRAVLTQDHGVVHIDRTEDSIVFVFFAGGKSYRAARRAEEGENLFNVPLACVEGLVGVLKLVVGVSE